MTDEIFIPAIAREMAADLTRDTGVAPTVRKYVVGFLLEHENEHVHMTIRYKQRSGKWSWAGSTLTIKGERQKILAHGYDDYVKIFGQGHRDELIVQDAPVIEYPNYPLADEADAPGIVRSELIKNRREARKHGGDAAAVTLHRHEDVYIVSCRGPVLSVNITFSQQEHGEWSFAWSDKIVLAMATHDDVLYDVSAKFAELGFDVQRLLGAMGHDLPQTNIPQQIHRTAEPKRLNSVEVRNSSVMRV